MHMREFVTICIYGMDKILQIVDKARAKYYNL